MLINVLNESTLVSNDEVNTMCQAIQIQLNEMVAPAWEGRSATVQFQADKTKVENWSWVVHLLDDATTAGALGYHSDDLVNGVGVVEAFVFASPVLSNGGTMMVYNPSQPEQYTVSATISHEIIEIYGDRFANGFSVGPQISQGNLYAQELCDPVEATNIPITVGNIQVATSNFIYPSWLNPLATAAHNMPFDHLKTLSQPFTMASGGYMIVASFSGEGQVLANRIFGVKMPEWRRKTKETAFSRGAIKLATTRYPATVPNTASSASTTQ
jgi:hypothetical protein